MRGLMDAEDPALLLISKARQGDRAAFSELAKNHQKRLDLLIDKRIQARSLQGKVDLEDVVQETLSRAFQSIQKFQWQGAGSFYGWLGGIAERVLLEEVRRHRRDPRLKLGDVPATDVTPSRALRRNERFDRLKAALKELRSDYRQVIELSRLEGLRIKDVAARMNRTPEATRKLLSRALDELKTRFGDTESLHLPDRRLMNDGGGHADE